MGGELAFVPGERFHDITEGAEFAKDAEKRSGRSGGGHFSVESC
jgi:hypothetical protein